MKRLVRLLPWMLAAVSAGTIAWQQVQVRRESRALEAMESDARSARRQLNQARGEPRRAEALRAAAGFDAIADGLDLEPAFARSLRERVALVRRLRQWLQDRPRENLPELQFLDDADWFEAVAMFPALGASEAELRHAAQDLQERARTILMKMLLAGVGDFMRQNGGQRPASMEELARILAYPIAPEILERYAYEPAGEIGATGEVVRTQEMTPLFVERIPSGVEVWWGRSSTHAGDIGAVFAFGVSRSKEPSSGPGSVPGSDGWKMERIMEAFAAFAQANRGKWATQVDDLKPYLKDISVLEGFTWRATATGGEMGFLGDDGRSGK